MITTKKQLQSSLFRLDDEETVTLDSSGKSPAYFCRRRPVSVTKDLISELKDMGAATGRVIRLCLHESPEAELHNMIMVQYAGKYFIPHKHSEKGEILHIIEGELGVFIFDEDGEVTEACRMGAEGNMIYGIGENMYHAYVPLTEVVVYHESKSGPFTSGDSIFAPWGPDMDDKEAVQHFVMDLLRSLPPQ
jgi:glucose-6-phosphate isomerase